MADSILNEHKIGCAARRSRAPRLAELPRHTAVDVGGGDTTHPSPPGTVRSASETNNNNNWQNKDGDRLCVTHSRSGALLRSHAALSADYGHHQPSSPRTRRTPRESRRVSVAQASGYVQLNQYRLLDSIGQGSYGIVKLAYNEEDDTHYAMKILSKRKLLRRVGLFGRTPPRRPSATPVDPLHRVYREIAVLKKLDHPNVVKLVEVLDDPAEDQLYLVFQLLEGGPVLDVPTPEPLAEEVTRQYFRDVILGIEYLHYQRIIHRDIKPANLLLSCEGDRWRVQVADLGVCDEISDDDAMLTGTVGTPAFRAPEVGSNHHSYDGKAADVWSLGVTLFSMVYGKVPWFGDTVLEIQENIGSKPLEFPAKPIISSSLTHLITSMLQKDPAKRLTVKEIKEHPWITLNGKEQLPSEDENCRLVEVTEEDMAKVVTSIPNLATLILIKTMLKKHSFQNPFSRSREGSTPRNSTPESTTSEIATSSRPGLARAGRSTSAPGNYLTDRQTSFENNMLPAVKEMRDSVDAVEAETKTSNTENDKHER